MGMQVREIQLQCEVGQIDDLSEDEQVLLRKAIEASANARAPYSGFHVGAAVLCEGGEIFVGTNQETASYDGVHAERVALGAAGTAGQAKNVRKIAVAGHPKNQESRCPTTPCGGCRQCLVEYEDEAGVQLILIMGSTHGAVFRVVGARNLLPLGFGPKDFV